MPTKAKFNFATREETAPETYAASPARVAYSAQEGIRIARRQAIERTVAHFVSLVNSDYPEIDTLEDARKHLGIVWRSIVPAARGPNIQTAVQRYQYGEAKVAEIRSMTQAQADAYDPAADGGWPG